MKRWTDEETATLMAMKARGVRSKEVATALGRTAAACRMRYQHMVATPAENAERREGGRKSQPDFKAMNDAFCMALRTAVALGQEHAEPGIVTEPQTDMARLVIGSVSHGLGNCCLADA